MSAIEILLSRRMVIRKLDPKLYYQVKDEIKSVKKFIQEKLGYIITVTPHLIKLEKVPAVSEIWMGIQEFQSVKEYRMFCYLLMFLEDKEIEEQFVLSHLTEFLHHQFDKDEIDWTNFTTRRQFIRVIRFAIDNYLLILNDGNESDFATDISTEVLYENTGVSRYFIRNFSKNIMEYKEAKDFYQSDWIDIDEDRGIARRQRIYRKLLLSCGTYRNDVDEDFLYLRNYINQIQLDFQKLFPCDLHLHQSSAFLVLDESSKMGKTFPENNTLSDLILSVNQALRKNVLKDKISANKYEQIFVDEVLFKEIIEADIERHIEILPKSYREQGSKSVAQNVIDTMAVMGFIKQEENYIIVYPIVAKVIGSYE